MPCDSDGRRHVEDEVGGGEARFDPLLGLARLQHVGKDALGNRGSVDERVCEAGERMGLGIALGNSVEGVPSEVVRQE